MLVVNADDFGGSPEVNRGIIRAHEQGIVTSASLLVGFPAAQEAAEYATRHPELSVGLHVDLGESTTTEDSPTWAAQELESQLEAFRRLVGADPTHLDSHYHVHRDEPYRTVFAALAERLDVPLRLFDPRVCYHGGFWGLSESGDPRPDAVGVQALLAILARLPAGVTELGCHPGERNDLDAYGRQREIEIETLCDPSVRVALVSHGIELRSFATLKGDCSSREP